MEVYWLHFPVVMRPVMFGQIIPHIWHAWFPENMVMVLFNLIFSQIEALLHGLWLFLVHSIVCNFMCSGILIFCCCLCLGVYHFVQGGVYRFCLLVVV